MLYTCLALIKFVAAWLFSYVVFFKFFVFENVHLVYHDYDAKGTVDFDDHFVSFTVPILRKFQSVMVK